MAAGREFTPYSLALYLSIHFFLLTNQFNWSCPSLKFERYLGKFEKEKKEEEYHLVCSIVGKTRVSLERFLVSQFFGRFFQNTAEN